VLQFFTANGNKISIRPSGTEPKVKFYFGVKAALPRVEDFDKVDAELEQMIGEVMRSLEL
jgi:phosphoglucomutase